MSTFIHILMPFSWHPFSIHVPVPVLVFPSVSWCLCPYMYTYVLVPCVCMSPLCVTPMLVCWPLWHMQLVHTLEAQASLSRRERLRAASLLGLGLGGRLELLTDVLAVLLGELVQHQAQRPPRLLLRRCLGGHWEGTGQQLGGNLGGLGCI